MRESVEEEEQKKTKTQLFNHFSEISTEMTSIYISGELMNFIDTAPFSSRFAEAFVEMVLWHLSEMHPVVCY